MEQYGKLVESKGCLLLSMKENKLNNTKLNNSLMEHIFVSQRYLNIVLVSNDVLEQIATLKKKKKLKYTYRKIQIRLQLDKFPRSEPIHVAAFRPRNKTLPTPRGPFLPPPVITYPRESHYPDFQQHGFLIACPGTFCK